MSLMTLVVICNLENLMTSRDFRIIRAGIANINFLYLMAKGGDYEEVVTGLIRTLGDRLE